MSNVERRRHGDLSDEEVADVEVFTGVQATELRFGIVPEVKLWFDGEPAERHSSETERENLPEEVEPGETYRDVGVRWRARGRIVHPTDPDD
ncbi:MAG TPA: hypothetical protein VFU04_06615 [Solirubrobacterales bacterium]|nr:hypothetical protein [Solirubrobacterales bacterium]